VLSVEESYMTHGIKRNLHVFAVVVICLAAAANFNFAKAEDKDRGKDDRPALRGQKVLDHVRLLVGSNSNFGAPLARTDQRPGSILSIDPNGATLPVPADFAFAGGQASTLGGRVQFFTANNAAFLNSIQNPAAVTANFTGASNPLGLSMNWAFGRLWPANAPTGLRGTGTSTILDPQGWGLAGAPNAHIGGVSSRLVCNGEIA
jgi:hypothetical protein